MSIHVREVLPRLLSSGSTQTFVILDVIGLPVGSFRLPMLKLRETEERVLLMALRSLHDRSYELLQEVRPQQLRPVVVDEVDEQPLDVAPVLVLIRHYHHPSVPESGEHISTGVLLAVL